MPSQFYRAKFEQPFPISMLFFETLGMLLQAANEVEEEPNFVELISEALQRCELCAEPTEEDLTYAAQRVLQFNEDSSKVAGQPQSASPKKHFATQYLKWVSELKAEEMCLHAAGYDWELAQHLYCAVDRVAVAWMAERRVEADYHEKIVLFESCLFGFGGSYGGESDVEIDMQADREGAKAQLRTLGF